MNWGLQKCHYFGGNEFVYSISFTVGIGLSFHVGTTFVSIGVLHLEPSEIPEESRNNPAVIQFYESTEQLTFMTCCFCNPQFI